MKSIDFKGFFKKSAFALLAAAVLIFGFTPKETYASAANPDTGYEVLIDDQADLLTDSEEAELYDIMYEITSYGNAVFLTVDENYYTASYLAKNYYSDEFGSASGTIFVIDMDNRELYIYSFGDVYDTVTSSKAEAITDNVYKMASNEDYAGCANEAFEEIETLLLGGRIAQPMKYICNALLAIMIALIINFIIIYKTSRMKPKKSIISGATASVLVAQPEGYHVHQTKTYSPRSSSSGGGGHSGGGGGHSGGGGGHSGGGGHGF